MEAVLLTAALAAFVIAVAALLALRPIAYAVDLVDRPGGHKTHHGIVPVVGGLGMLLGITFGLAAQATPLGNLQSYLFSAVMLAVVGMLDDRFNLSPRLRLVAQFAAVLPMFFGASVRLTNVGDIFGVGSLDVSHVSLLATAVVAIASINAFNMLDGLDGLAGGVSLVAIVVALAMPGATSHLDESRLLAVLFGAVAGFLLFNVPVSWNRRLRCFMGDAGSTLLGFSLAWCLIGLSQGGGRVASPISMVWLVAVPATDLLSTVIRRISRGQSPFYPDNEHLHHMFLRAGLGVRATFVVLCLVALICGIIGVLFDRFHFAEWLSLVLLIAAGTLIVALARNARLLRNWLPRGLRRDQRHVGLETSDRS